ncbi:hypothetical protein ACH4SK_06770 [Streptomyces inhibens]|uniref:hypothetical protein n=1 Tax=Streptomyces inhibens TaxID=2293571 RepID=UPI003790A9B7
MHSASDRPLKLRHGIDVGVEVLLGDLGPAHPEDRARTGPERAEVGHRLARAAGIESPRRRARLRLGRRPGPASF